MLKRYVVCIGFVNDVLSMLMNSIFCVFFSANNQITENKLVTQKQGIYIQYMI